MTPAAALRAALAALPAGAAQRGRPGIGNALVFRAAEQQALHTVPFLQHCLILVVDGTKRASLDGDDCRAGSGQALVVRPGVRLDIGNLPDARSGRYQSSVLTVDDGLIAEFAHHYPELAARGDPAISHHVLTDTAALLPAMLHALDGICHAETVTAPAARHRLMEVLLALAEHGVSWAPPRMVCWAMRLRMLVAARPAEPWSAADAAQALNVSEPTLRRRLAAEGESYRGVLAETRLAHGLTLLMTTDHDIIEVAAFCGYDSPSRFASRFRERFGMAPSRLRLADARNGADIERFGREAASANG